MAATLLDLLDHAVLRYGDRHALGIRLDDGGTTHWTYRDLDRRARIAAWRLRALDLEPGDRILTWSPSMPELAATYYGAMYARLVFVPLDLRMSADAVEVIAKASGARHLILGSGPRCPRPARGPPGALPHDDRGRALRGTRQPMTRCSRPTGRRARRPGSDPTATDVFQLVFTSGTTGHAQGRDAHARQRGRVGGVVPSDRAPDGASDRLAAPAVAPARAGGRAVLRARCRGGRALRPQPEPARHLRFAARPSRHEHGGGPPGPRPVLERHHARSREARPDGRLRSIAFDRPTAADALPTDPVPQHPPATGRRLPPVPLVGGVPAAGPPAGLGGPRA